MKVLLYQIIEHYTKLDDMEIVAFNMVQQWTSEVMMMIMLIWTHLWCIQINTSILKSQKYRS